MNGIKNIIREVAPECVDVSILFDDDGLKPEGGDFNYSLFILSYDRYRYYGFNYELYKDITNKIDNFIDDFTVNRDRFETRKEVMTEYEIKYNPRLCHELTVFCENTQYITSPSDVARFLTITTGKTWKTTTVNGYCQGDTVTVLYCTACYTDKSARTYGEYYLGCCKEFEVIDVDQDGNETDCCGGYFVADNQIDNWRESDNEYKRLVCDQAGIDADETRLELIDGSHTYTSYSYKYI